MAPSRNLRRLCLLGAIALLSFSVACHLDMLLKAKNSPRAALTISPMEVRDSARAGSRDVRQAYVEVTNSGTGQLSWTATEDRSWMSLGTTSGTGNGTIPLTINSSGLAGGTYHGDIVVTSPGAIGSPAHVSVTLTILAPVLAVTPGA